MRILLTGLSTFWGGRLAQALEARDDVEVIVGVDTRDRRVPLERTEFVRCDSTFSILTRIVAATQVDTVLHTHLVVDSTRAGGRALHEINVIGTMNLLAAAGAPGSPVRKVVLKSSALVYGSNKEDPYVFKEDVTRSRGARTNVERSLLEVEAFLRDFADDNPHIAVTLLRFANVLGDDIDTPLSHALRLPVVPEIFGFDPRLQFVHEDDVVGALTYATAHDVPGVFNVAGDGALPWSEICALVGKRRVALPPVLTNWAAEPLRLARVLDLPVEVLALLRYGRGIDNTRFKQAGYEYEHTTAGTVDAFARGLRLAKTIGDKHPSYRYEHEVEDFFRHSPAVVRSQD
ncbi:MAG: NAD-dependent epimerase/dehydratase family protein [Acidimicrobiia bacterium]|nr:NAD-dependent epimerase/dehydratase family protein [Acidimicrobiia bacterium]